MNIKHMRLEELKPAEKFLLSFPLKPELYYEQWEKFAHIPFIIVNQAAEILFGIDFYRLLESRLVTEIAVLQMNIDDKEAVFLNFNLKAAFTGVNLYEKLVFVKKIMPLADVSEIYERTGLDISINRELTAKLDLLVSTLYRDALIDEQIGLKTALKLCDFQPGDTEVLMDLFQRVPFTSSHQLKILEMAEEIIFRDKCSLEEIFEKLDIEGFMALERPQKDIIEALFKYRFPVYVETEAKWLEEIKALNLPGNIKVTHYPFFEKKQMEVTIQVPDAEELKKLIEKITPIK